MYENEIKIEIQNLIDETPGRIKKEYEAYVQEQTAAHVFEAPTKYAFEFTFASLWKQVSVEKQQQTHNYFAQRKFKFGFPNLLPL